MFRELFEKIRHHIIANSKKQLRQERDDWKRWCKQHEFSEMIANNEVKGARTLIGALLLEVGGEFTLTDAAIRDASYFIEVRDDPTSNSRTFVLR